MSDICIKIFSTTWSIIYKRNARNRSKSHQHLSLIKVLHPHGIPWNRTWFPLYETSQFALSHRNPREQQIEWVYKVCFMVLRNFLEVDLLEIEASLFLYNFSMFSDFLQKSKYYLVRLKDGFHISQNHCTSNLHISATVAMFLCEGTMINTISHSSFLLFSGNCSLFMLFQFGPTTTAEQREKDRLLRNRSKTSGRTTIRR